MVVYNSLLPVFSLKKKIGSLSGKAWAAGYAGGILCLLIILFGFVQNENPLFGIEKDQAANIRIAGPIVAIWFIIFSIPLFLKIKKNKNLLLSSLDYPYFLYGNNLLVALACLSYKSL